MRKSQTNLSTSEYEQMLIRSCCVTFPQQVTRMWDGGPDRVKDIATGELGSYVCASCHCKSRMGVYRAPDGKWVCDGCKDSVFKAPE